MKYLIVIIMIAGILSGFGCLSNPEENSPLVTISPTVLGSFTPRFYKDGDSFDSNVSTQIDVPTVGTIGYSGTLNVVVSDGGTINSSLCLLSTSTINISTNNELAILAGYESYQYVILVYFYEDTSGFYVVRIDDNGSVTDYGGVGFGGLDVPYPITDVSSWTGVDGTLQTVSGAFDVDVEGDIFTCFRVDADGGTYSKYISEFLGSQIAPYSITDLEGGTLTSTIVLYTLMP